MGPQKSKPVPDVETQTMENWSAMRRLGVMVQNEKYNFALQYMNAENLDLSSKWNWFVNSDAVETFLAFLFGYRHEVKDLNKFDDFVIQVIHKYHKASQLVPYKYATTNNNYLMQAIVKKHSSTIIHALLELNFSLKYENASHFTALDLSRSHPDKELWNYIFNKQFPSTLLPLDVYPTIL